MGNRSTTGNSVEGDERKPSPYPQLLYFAPTLFHTLLMTIFYSFFIAVEPLRLWLGYSGNLKERVPDLAGAFLFTLFPQAFCCFYFMSIQPKLGYGFTTPFEVALNSTYCLLLLPEAVLAYLAASAIVRAQAASFFLTLGVAEEENGEGDGDGEGISVGSNNKAELNSFTTLVRKMRPTSTGSQSQSRLRSLHLRQSRPSTAASLATSAATGFNSNVVAALCEGRGTASEVGLVCFDKGSGEVALSQFADLQMYAKTLQQLHLIVVPSTLMEPSKARIIEIIQDNFGDGIIVPANRAWFNQNKGVQNITELSLDESVIPGLSTKLYFATSCVAAVLTYMEERDDITFYRNSLRFKFFSLDGIMSIATPADHITARNLELIINLESNSTVGSLYGVLNSCLTGMGSRLLRMNVLQPLNDAATIACRLDAVEELKANHNVLSDVRLALKASVDMDALITTILYRPKKHTVKVTESYINGIITLKHVVSTWIIEVQERVAVCQSELLKVICGNLRNESLTELAALIDERINADIAYQKNAQGMRNQRCYAIKAGWNGLLDVARQTYRESTNDVYDLVSGYSATYGIPIKTVYTNAQGYTLKFSLADLEDRGIAMPAEFINVTMNKKTASCTTLALLGFNDRIRESLTEVYLMSDRIVADLVEGVARYARVLYNVSESVALLDVVAGFAYVAEVREFVRPEFTETYAVKAGKHPIKDQMASASGGQFIPNDVYCCDGSNVQIIGGPNMSGKTTYLKMVVLLNIMAQMGCFVPAATFILQNVCDASLVVIDELGRGTSHTDGVSMSIAITEKLAETKAFIFVASHFIELGQTLSTRFPNVVKLHLHVECTETTDDSVSIHYKYTVQDGTTNLQHYGLTIATLARFPERTVSRAAQIAEHLEAAVEAAHGERDGDAREARTKADVRVYHRLVQTMLNSRLEEEDLRKYLKTLWDELI
ncbi:DNA mismatch repair protein MutS [Chytriomyces sp. MP71]|nr:DNA mismatch repair protein MutS [Chytriomyces sp. MP71]